MCSNMLSLTGKNIEVIRFGKELYKKWAGKEIINMFIMASNFMIFKFMVSPIYFMFFVIVYSFF